MPAARCGYRQHLSPRQAGYSDGYQIEAWANTTPARQQVSRRILASVQGLKTANPRPSWTTIDRGTRSDTMAGEGTKIDNLVQIAHNVVIGRHCIIVAQSGIAGSAELGDFVVMGAKSGVLDHVKVGRGAQIAGMAHVKDDVAPGAKMGGTPARPFKEWAREVAALRLLGRRASAA